MKPQQTRLEYPSAGGKSNICGLLWDADTAIEPRAILQIIHGAVEHVSRYWEFANYLNQRGVIVCGADLIGHGLTAVPEVADRHLADKRVGLMPAKGGSDILVEDVHKLRQLMSEQYPDLPYLMLGHSMGSFILRVYLGKYGKNLAGAILSGTGQPAQALSIAGNIAARLTAVLRGEDYRSTLLDNIGMGSLNKAVQNPKTSHDWLSASEANVKAYLDDPLCGQIFSAGSYATLTSLTAKIVKPKNAIATANQRKNLPILFIAGADDPVGDCGKGVDRAALQYMQAGMNNIERKIYVGMRHELLNEDQRVQVYGDVWDWIERTIG